MVCVKMVMRIRKLDKRMTGYGDFKYGADFSWHWQGARFDQVRQWCWETFGPSVEVDIWRELGTIDEPRNERWAWDRNQYRTMVYLKSDAERNWFVMRWGVE